MPTDAAFASGVMMGEGELPFEKMKLKQLKDELAARGGRRSGLKAMLQHRLHGLLVQAAIVRHAAEDEGHGGGAAADQATAAAEPPPPQADEAAAPADGRPAKRPRRCS